MENSFNFEEALKALQSGKLLYGKDGILAPLVKQLTEAALQAELEGNLEADDNLIAKMARQVKQ
jgi:hypothetical protein